MVFGSVFPNRSAKASFFHTEIKKTFLDLWNIFSDFLRIPRNSCMPGRSTTHALARQREKDQAFQI